MQNTYIYFHKKLLSTIDYRITSHFPEITYTKGTTGKSLLRTVIIMVVQRIVIIVPMLTCVYLYLYFTHEHCIIRVGCNKVGKFGKWVIRSFKQNTFGEVGPPPPPLSNNRKNIRYAKPAIFSFSDQEKRSSQVRWADVRGMI